MTRRTDRGQGRSARLLAASDRLSSAAILASLLLPPGQRVLRLPQVRRLDVDNLEADLFLPECGPSPGIVLALGALREGRRYELLQKAASSVSSCGFAVLVPELGRLRRLVLDGDAVNDLVQAALVLPRLDGVIDAPVGLIGFSLGGSLALLAAADPRLQNRVAFVAAMGAYFRLTDMLTAATTQGTLLMPPSQYAIVASLVATLPDPDRELLESALDSGRESPLQAVAQIETGSVGPRARNILGLLRNRDSSRVASLASAIDDLPAMLAALSPESVIDRLTVPIWALHDERDRYVPFSQFEVLRSAAAGRPNWTFLATRLFEHTEPLPPMLDPRRLLGDYVPGLIKLFRFVHGPLATIRDAANRP